jgi:TPP-dependent 2-oxoacid decarboxylase
MHTETTSYTVIDHLLDRLTALGVEKIFGVPGDFTLEMLDRVEAHPDVDWVGCSGELGAAYAADGYARVRGLGVVSTTFGVGELSAVNGIAGSYAERVPVIHVVGAPSTTTQRAAQPTHHTLGDGDFRHFMRMHAEVTCVQAALTLENAALEIDHVIREVLERRLPGYILIPADVGLSEIDPSPDPLLLLHDDRTSSRAIRRFRQAIEPTIREASRPAVLADILVERFGAREALHELLETGVPHASLLWGRRAVDEAAPTFVGTYVGEASREVVRATVEDADLLIQAGVQFTDLTSGFFSQRLPEENTIVIDGTTSTVNGVTFGPITMVDALRSVREAFDERTRPLPGPPTERPPVLPDDHDGDALTQARLWRIINKWLRGGDLVLADQGTSFYGMGAHRLPSDVLFMGQPLWASIGFTLPAILGAALAAPSRRPVLLIGDGAAQLTIQELGTLVRQAVPAIVVVVDNGGYTVERAIHGADAAYNDIAEWDWVALGRALGAESARRVDSTDDLRTALSSARNAVSGVHVVVAAVPRDDVPPLLSAIAQAAATANRTD